MFSFGHYARYGATSHDFVRFERTTNLFYDEKLDDPVEITFGDTALRMQFKNGRFEGHWKEKETMLPEALYGNYEQLSIGGGGGGLALCLPLSRTNSPSSGASPDQRRSSFCHPSEPISCR